MRARESKEERKLTSDLYGAIRIAEIATSSRGICDSNVITSIRCWDGGSDDKSDGNHSRIECEIIYVPMKRIGVIEVLVGSACNA